MAEKIGKFALGAVIAFVAGYMLRESYDLVYEALS